MTLEAQRIAIGQALGFDKVFRRRKGEKHPRVKWLNVEKGFIIEFLPNYPQCLNAMREAEEFWFHDDDHWYSYEKELRRFFCADQLPLRVIGATAPQRAEAFLRTLNLWVD